MIDRRLLTLPVELSGEEVDKFNDLYAKDGDAYMSKRQFMIDEILKPKLEEMYQEVDSDE